MSRSHSRFVELSLILCDRLVTSITGQLAAEVTPFEAIAGAFPPGSMTGAPKLRSVQILEQLERNVPRGVYAGAFPPSRISEDTDAAMQVSSATFRLTERPISQS